MHQVSSAVSGTIHDDLRLKVHLVLETGAGGRIAEVRTEDLFQAMFSLDGIDTADGAIRGLLQAKVISPARALVLAHLHGVREQQPFVRLDRPSADVHWPDPPAESAAFDASVAEAMRLRILDAA